MSPPETDRARREAQLYVDALDVAGRIGAWAAKQRPPGGPARPVVDRVEERALDLVESVSVALAPCEDRIAEVQQLDTIVTRLRALLRVAHNTELLNETAFVDLSGRLDGIGRQTGGWLRRLHDDAALSR
jgi:hypothetical protein